MTIFNRDGAGVLGDGENTLGFVEVDAKSIE